MTASLGSLALAPDGEALPRGVWPDPTAEPLVLRGVNVCGVVVAERTVTPGEDALDPRAPVARPIAPPVGTFTAAPVVGAHPRLEVLSADGFATVAAYRITLGPQRTAFHFAPDADLGAVARFAQAALQHLLAAHRRTAGGTDA